MTRIFQTKVESGERLVATDITDLTFFPVGSILMMDGGWTDGRGGWYICDGREKTLPDGSKVKTPDLQDKFIKGKGSLANAGGSNALTSAMLPKHTHGLSGNTTSAGDHKHGLYVGNFYPPSNNLTGGNQYFYLSEGVTGTDWTAHKFSNIQPSTVVSHSIQSAGAHVHSLSGTTAQNDNSVTTDSNTSNMPVYYSVIYIKKCV
jgi:hypothetical protein